MQFCLFIYFFEKYNLIIDLKIFTAGSVCSEYPSSARRGLVIFHEHIADLLSGGVSLLST